MQLKKECKANRKHRGTTLVEMMVCFALVGIFMSAAAVVIANVTNIYYDVQGETYARQVSDIVLRKISGEIEGARINLADPTTAPVIYQTAEDAGAGNRSGYKIELFDRTDTRVQMYEDQGVLVVRYAAINPDMEITDEDYDTEHFEETRWTFDEKMYMGFTIKELRFVPANQGVTAEISPGAVEEEAGYSLTAEYPGNVIGVYLTLESPKYGEFYSYRYIKMYNLEDEAAQSFNIELITAEKD